jgi:hypothetical protein
MADVEIRETIIAPISDGLAVRLQISDVPLNAENAAILLDLRVRLLAYERPFLAQVQRETIQAVMTVLRKLDQALTREIQGDDPRIEVPIEPTVKQRQT